MAGRRAEDAIAFTELGKSGQYCLQAHEVEEFVELILSQVSSLVVCNHTKKREPSCAICLEKCLISSRALYLQCIKRVYQQDRGELWLFGWLW